MSATIEKQELAKQLQAKINAMQGLGKLSDEPAASDLAPFTAAFPANVFPVGAIHEFVSYEPVDAASTSGFITALTGKFMKDGGLCLWIGNGRKVFPTALKHFGLSPDRIIFINAPKLKDTLWIIEEALKCEALTAVIGEISELGFTESRRFQLEAERSGVIGFVHRYRPRSENATACTTRWKITPLPAVIDEGLPGVGHSCWNVELLKVKNGRPTSWEVSFLEGRFHERIEKQIRLYPNHQRNAM